MTKRLLCASAAENPEKGSLRENSTSAFDPGRILMGVQGAEDQFFGSPKISRAAFVKKLTDRKAPPTIWNEGNRKAQGRFLSPSPVFVAQSIHSASRRPESTGRLSLAASPNREPRIAGPPNADRSARGT